MTVAEFRALVDGVRSWGRWGPDDGAGALHHLTAQRRQAALAAARDGCVVSCAWPISSAAIADAVSPFVLRLTSPGAPGRPAGRDRLELSPHGTTITHIDALSHVTLGGRLFGDVDPARVTEEGAAVLGAEAFAGGIVGRGVLVDLPRLWKVDWPAPGAAAQPADLDQWQEQAGLRVEAGDLVLVRTGRGARYRASGPFDIRAGSAGLHPRSLGWLAEREVALLGDDGINEVIPSLVEGETHPNHRLALGAMGMPLVDNLQLEDLAAACAERGRWAFLLVIAPLHIPGATGVPVNPLALL